MYRQFDRHVKQRRMATRILVAALVVPLGVSLALAAGPFNSEKLARQIGIVERTLDQALVDSPNFLVTSGHNSAGFHIPEFGVVFTFNAELVDDWFQLTGLPSGSMSDVEVIKTKDGESQIIIHKSKQKSLADKLGLGGKDEEKVRELGQLYEAGKTELLQLLMDEGGTLRALPDGQHVMICAKMNDDELKREKKIQRLTLRAKIDDLRAYADDKLSEAEMKARIVIDES